MALSHSAGRGELRSAIEGLLRACVDIERGAHDAHEQTEARVRRVTAGLAAVRPPAQVVDVAALAQEVDGVGQRLGADLAVGLAAARQPYVAEIHALLALLAPLHGLAPIPSFTPTAPTATLDGRFPAGFAQEYVADLLGGVHRSTTLARDDAAGVGVVAPEDADEAIAGSRAGFSDDHRSDGVELLAADECHAVERHGPQIPAEAQLVRLLWLKDPTGERPWHIDPSGAVITDHRCGVAAGGFTSPEALAKPVGVVLERARAAGSLDAFLDATLDESTTKVGVHVTAEQAGLEAGDTFGYHGAGTGTRETRRDWLAARKYALRHGSGHVYGAPYDPIATGDDPGATIVFARTTDGWRVVTCFPVERQEPMNLRLEDFE